VASEGAIQIAIAAALLGREHGLNWMPAFYRACTDMNTAKKLHAAMVKEATEKSKSPHQIQRVTDIVCGRMLIDRPTLCDLIKFSVRQRKRKTKKGKHYRQEQPITISAVGTFIEDEYGAETARQFERDQFGVIEAGEAIEAWRAKQRAITELATLGRKLKAASKRELRQRAGGRIKKHGNLRKNA
jgi:hypothetical protein